MSNIGNLTTERNNDGIKKKINKDNSRLSSSDSLSSTTYSSSDSSFAIKSLNDIRKRLLDLSSRNNLLNYKHPKKNSLRIIDELPDQLSEVLLSKKKITFKSVPNPKKSELIKAGYIKIDPDTDKEITLKKAPTASQWAKYLGFDTDFQLPTAGKENSLEDKFQDNKIQTLLYSSEMETVLKNITKKSIEAIDEKGVNILYLALGFLEWFESDKSNGKFLAPLYLIPVRLEKGKLDKAIGGYSYYLDYSGEDLLPNFSLREKLLQDFGLDLPSIDDASVEDYFAKVSKMSCQPKEQWQVHRYASLCLLDFTKLIMYRDLDPKRWPDGQGNIHQHPIIQTFFSGSKQECLDNNDYNEEYIIDELDSIHELYPLIDNADSSQHSALIDAVKGKNLVIEGPPGTGKSQTITNLIAATLAQGKKVLFVAEKMAALNVVKKRLDRAGLGDFCLELHSHKSNKRSLLDSANLAFDRRKTLDQQSKSIEKAIKQYENFKQKLIDYNHFIQQPWKNTGYQLKEILIRVTRYKNSYQALQGVISIEGLSGEDLTIDIDDENKQQLQQYKQAYKKITEQLEKDNIEQYPWYGVKNADIKFFDIDQVISYLTDWQQSLLGFDQVFKDICNDLSLDYQTVAITEKFDRFVRDARTIPEVKGDEWLDALPKIYESGIEDCIVYFKNYQYIQNSYDSFKKNINLQFITDRVSIKPVAKSLAFFQSLGVDDSKSLDQIIEMFNTLTTLSTIASQLKKRLDEIMSYVGGDFKSIISDTRKGLSELVILMSLVKQIDSSLIAKKSEVFKYDELDDYLPNLKHAISDLRLQHDVLSSKYDLQKVPDTKALQSIRTILQDENFFSVFDLKWRRAKKRLFNCRATKEITYPTLHDSLPDLIQYQNEFELFMNESAKNTRLLGDIWINFESSIKQKEEGIWLLDEPWNQLSNEIDDLIQLRHWYKNVRREYGVGLEKRGLLGNQLLSFSSQIFEMLQSSDVQDLMKDAKTLLDGVEIVSNVFCDITIFRVEKARLAGSKGLLGRLLLEMQNHLPQLQRFCLNTDLNVLRIAQLIDQYTYLFDCEEKFLVSKVDEQYFNGQLGLKLGPNNHQPVKYDRANRTVEIASFVKNNMQTEAIKHSIIKSVSNETLNFIRDKLTMLVNEYDKQEQAFIIFQQKVLLDNSMWLAQSNDLFSDIISRNQRALDHPQWLHNWMDYLKFSQRLTQRGLRSFVQAVEKKQLMIEDLQEGYQFVLFDMLSREIFHESAEIDHYSGIELSNIRAQFIECDEKLHHLQQKKIAWKIGQKRVPLGKKGALKSDYTEYSLLEYECWKKTKHISIRQLIKRASKALSVLMPCFMMSPMSVAQYLKPGLIDFDLLVMDEASQVKVEDALGVIARSKQIVVVGDPKQLPPTNFFTKMVKDDDNDTIIEDSESVLDACIPLFEHRRLRWHYRSQHESLIAFSNHHFYEGDLVVFPSPYHQLKDYGVNFIRVKKGIFLDGKNTEEAQVVAAAVKQHLLSNRNLSIKESIGVVAMNASQSELIEAFIENMAINDPLFQAVLIENRKEEEPLFIKNLENVQGDERDIIYISATYGPSSIEALNMHQRFGPINSQNGWRRLNVLFTRSKKRMHFFSSMDAGHILTNDSSSLGVKALKGFIEFAVHGGTLIKSLPKHTRKDTDADFEVDVADRLKSKGFECEYQVGVSGYFIDIVVLDPNQPGRYLMGIECDGATYQSAKSVRDRDKLRQSILEQLGWKIERIWSTDWFKNPEGQLLPIIEKLNHLKTKKEDQQVYSLIEEREYSVTKKMIDGQFTVRNSIEID